ncbi:hypothetical protein [Brucella rhizosphaerae]|uniref:hypothetical protein n=1 Tax=Brucella rhizosphaerae TaxID=571254 RepID=UPI003618C159
MNPIAATYYLIDERGGDGMLLHVNNEMENGIIAKIPLALDKDIKNFQGDAIDFEVSILEGHLLPADELHPYKSLFKVLSGNAELKNLYMALSFNLNFSTPDGKKPQWHVPAQLMNG